jgi:PAS domain S-box-containing protein
MREFLKRLFGPRNRDAGERMRGEQFDQLVAGVHDYAIFLLDAAGNVTTWNAGAERIKGYAADAIIGKHFSIFYTPEKVAAGSPTQELAAARNNGRFEDEGWRVRKDGSRFWADIVITALRDESGGVRGYLKITRDLTERKQADENARRLIEQEAARRAAEVSALEEKRHREQLHVTLRSIGDAVIVTDMNGAVSFMNPVAQDLTGWDPKAAAGQPLDRVFHIINEETRLEVENPVTKVLREGTTVGLANHTVLIARDGREYPIDDSGAPIRVEDGSIAGVVLVFRDVSEVRRAVETRLHLAAIVESSDDAIISKNLAGRIVSWNQGAERLYGYKAEEVVGQPLAILVPPDHPDEIPALMERLRRGERVDRFETVRVRKDGSRVDVALTISPVRNAEGKIVGASKIARDITAIKRTEAALRLSEQRLADELAATTRLHALSSRLLSADDLKLALEDVLENAIVTCGADFGNVQLLNTQSNVLEIVAQRGFREDFLNHFRAVRVDEGSACAQAMQRGDRIIIEDVELDPAFKPHRRVAAAAGYRAVQSTPLKTHDGKILGMMSTHFRAPHRLSERDQRLLDLYARHAADLIERLRYEEALKDSDRRKDEFLAMLSHELRNPLAPIRNALHLMAMPEAAAETVARAREMTERQVQYLVRLVDDLLDVSRIMRGRIELRRQAIDLAALIAAAAETVQPVLDAQGQELVVSQPNEPVRLYVDPTRITQVIGNLLNNAAKFSHQAGRVWLTAERHDGEAVVRVRDEGMGIPLEVLPNVFDLFVQGDKSLERGRGGLGIGLTVVRRLVELHGGRIEAHSEGPGCGSEFVVRLPIGTPPAEFPMLPTDGVQPLRDPRRLLVVDDNVDAAETLAMLMRMWGHEVRLAFTGPEALRAAEQFRPEIIVLDIGLPEINGYEVARRLRARPEFATATLIALTGYGQEEDRRRSNDAGFDHHLTKPVAPDALRQLLAAPLKA